MIKTVIGDIEVQNWITEYSCKNPPVFGDNGFTAADGEKIPNKLGDEVLLDITLEDVPTPISVALAAALEADEVDVDYTTPIPKRSKFYKTDYVAECEDADPESTDYDYTDGIKWTIRISLKSSGLAASSGCL